jgi:Cu(I)/Ag(I) efflux system membrane fusion protein
MMSSPADRAPVAEDRIEVPSQFKVQLDGVFDAYFVVQDALSHDRFGDAQTGAARLQKALESIDMGLVPKSHHSAWMTEYGRLKQSATQISTAKDIEAARAAYEPLSNGLIVAAKKYGTSGKQPIRRYHCPMAFNNRGADWLHNKPGLENPYFGAAMFSCGVLKEVIEPGPAVKTEGGN